MNVVIIVTMLKDRTHRGKLCKSNNYSNFTEESNINVLSP